MGPKPNARAASTNGISRSASALLRRTKAHRGTMGTVMAKMTFVIPEPSNETTTRAKMINGNDKSRSMKRWSTRSILPPK